MERWWLSLHWMGMGLGLPVALMVGLGVSPAALAQGRSPQTCPETLPELIDALLLDLPSYGNRVLQRQRLGDRAPYTYILLAGQPRIEPLNWADSAPLFQVFFTSLERQYPSLPPADEAPVPSLGEPLAIQQFHQVVLAQVDAPEHWRLIRWRSQLAPYPANGQILSPPRNADHGTLALATQLWLRDCTARNRSR